MNSKAIYTVTDDKGIHEFSTDIAGGFSYPFSIISAARFAVKDIKRESVMTDVQPHEMLPLMQANFMFPKEIQDKRIFSALTDEQAAEMKMNFIEKADIPYHITLDFQKNEIGFEFNKNIREDELCDLIVSADDERFSDVGYDSFMKLRPPDEVNECYRHVIVELCQSITMKNSPLIVVEMESPKGCIDIHLPISETEMNSLRSFIGAADIDSFNVKVKSVHHENLDCLKELWRPAFTVLNELTHSLRNNLRTTESPHETFAAVMEADHITDVKSALLTAQNIDAFECIHVADDEEYGYYVLYESCRDDIEDNFAQRVEDYIDFDSFGYDCAEDDGAVRTSKGYVVRNEQKLIQRMKQPNQEQTM